MKKIFLGLTAIDLFWLAVLMAGRVPTEVILFKYPSFLMAGALTGWSSLIIWGEIHYADLLIIKIGWGEKEWLKNLRRGKLAGNGKVGERLNKYFVRFELLTLYLLASAPSFLGGTMLACSLYSIARPKFGKMAIVLGIFTRYCYMIFLIRAF